MIYRRKHLQVVAPKDGNAVGATNKHAERAVQENLDDTQRHRSVPGKRATHVSIQHGNTVIYITGPQSPSTVEEKREWGSIRNPIDHNSGPASGFVAPESISGERDK